MSSAIVFGGATAVKPPSLLKKHRSAVAKFNSPNPNLTRFEFQKRIQYPNGSVSLRSVLRLRVSSNDAQFNSAPENNNQHKQQLRPSFTEFITSERVKVVAMLALALALCNADRVVMSVAIVPLSLANGWSRAFAGIVQVCKCYCFYLTYTPSV
jgi:ACS family sodium-dependent inorganic phosphate cotransporter